MSNQTVYVNFPFSFSVCFLLFFIVRIMMDSLICEFHSTPHLYKGDDEPDLRLEIHKYGSDAIQIKLFNKDVPIQKKNIKNQFVFYVTTSACYLWLLVHHRLICVEVLLGLWLLVLLWRWISLVESGNGRRKAVRNRQLY